MRGRFVGRHAVLLFAMLVLLYMFTPIFVVVLMSFNDPASRLGYDFDGFTLDNWTQPVRGLELCSSVGTSIEIGAARHGRGDPARHPDGVRDGAAPLPWAVARPTC